MPIRPYYIPRHPAAIRPPPVAPWSVPFVEPDFVPKAKTFPTVLSDGVAPFRLLSVSAWAETPPPAEEFVPRRSIYRTLVDAQPARLLLAAVAPWAVPEAPPTEPDFVPRLLVLPVISPRSPLQVSIPKVAPWALPATSDQHEVLVGSGYSDVSGKQLARTSENRVYLTVSDCESYPCELAAQTIRVWRADQTGVPTSFTRQNSAGEPAGVAGWSAAIDGSDILHIAWTYRTANGAALDGLRYTTFNTSTNLWSGTVETIISGGLTDGIGQGVQTVALAVDSAGVPHLTYLSGNGIARRIYYRNRVGGSWSAATQIDDTVTYAGNERAWHPNLVFDNTGRIVFAWLRGSFNGDNDGTIFTRVRQTGGSLDAVVNVSGTAAARTTIDQSTSLIVTGTNRYHIVYLQQPNDYWRYAYSDDVGQTWSTNNPGSGTHVSHNPSIGPNGTGGLRIYGHGVPASPPDGHGDDLYYFEGDGGGAAWSSNTLYTAGSFDSSVNTRWSQYFYNHPTYLDVIYWADPYPNNFYYGVDVGAGVAVYPAGLRRIQIVTAPEPRRLLLPNVSSWAVSAPAEPDFVPPVRRFYPSTIDQITTPRPSVAPWAEPPSVPPDFVPEGRYYPTIPYGWVAPYRFKFVAPWAVPFVEPDFIPRVPYRAPLPYGFVAPYSYLPVAPWAPKAVEFTRARSRIGSHGTMGVVSITTGPRGRGGAKRS